MALSKPPATDDDQAEREYLASCLMPLSRGLCDGGATDAKRAGAAPTASNKADGQHHPHGYECSMCSKVYASYQALGGHKTSHQKPPAAAAPRDEASSSGTAHEKEEKLHQCSLCLRTFLSGQALGGHKRLHCEAKDKGKDAARTNKASVAATAVLRDFDLNLSAEAESATPEAKRARTMLLVADDPALFPTAARC
ncbi:zinc finger protein AZF1 [Zea mays]|uniref:zinc finger protein AZF1 n=1 Tax=Zea mays TaxID=4577 RepID=UPI0009AA7A65|nr:zinc finger protein AZF1 [Zea mays]|eukprot:XP_020406636.1 zinc finger protein AZF1 [Zea mays]